MRPLSIKSFAEECGCEYETIRKKIGNEIIPLTENPVTIDAVEYEFIIKNYQNKNRVKEDNQDG